MTDNRPQNLTPEETEDLRKDAKEGHEWFKVNYHQLKAEARELVEKQMEYIRAGKYPPPELDRELFMGVEEMEAWSRALKEIHTELKGENVTR